MGVQQGQETAAAPPLTVWKLSENIKTHRGPRPRRSLIYGSCLTRRGATNLFVCYKSVIVSHAETQEHKHKKSEINGSGIEVIEVIL